MLTALPFRVLHVGHDASRELGEGCCVPAWCASNNSLASVK